MVGCHDNHVLDVAISSWTVWQNWLKQICKLIATRISLFSFILYRRGSAQYGVHLLRIGRPRCWKHGRTA